MILYYIVMYYIIRGARNNEVFNTREALQRSRGRLYMVIANETPMDRCSFCCTLRDAMMGAHYSCMCT